MWYIALALLLLALAVTPGIVVEVRARRAERRRKEMLATFARVDREERIIFGDDDHV